MKSAIKFSWCDNSNEGRNPIRRVSDVVEFFCFVVDDLDVNFHADDDFNEVVHKGGGKSFSDSDCHWYNLLLATCHEVCASAEVDIYGIGCDLLKIRECYEQAKPLLGKMVIAKNIVENYPFVWCNKGSLAKVIKVETEYVYVQLVEHDDNLDEWDNCVMYYDEVNNLNTIDFMRDWEVTEIHGYTYAITVPSEDDIVLTDDQKQDRLCENLEEVREFIVNEFPKDHEHYDWKWQPDGYGAVPDKCGYDCAIGFKVDDLFTPDLYLECIPLDAVGAIMNNGVNPHMLEKAKCDRCKEVLQDGDLRQDENHAEYYKCSSCHFMLHSDDYYSASSHGICPVCNEPVPCKHYPKDFSAKNASSFTIERVVFEGDAGIVIDDSRVQTKLLGNTEYMTLLSDLMNYGKKNGLLYGYDTSCE